MTVRTEERDEIVGQLKRALEEAKAMLAEQQKFIDQVSGPPRKFGVCLKTGKWKDKSTSVVISNNEIYEIEVADKLVKDVLPGKQLYMFEGQIVGVVESPDPIGHITTVAKILSPGLAEVHAEHSTSAAYFCTKTYPKLEEGNRVILDSTGLVIVADLGRPKDAFAFNKATGVSWDDIGGLEEQKALMREALERPILFPQLYKDYNKKPLKGVLLEGAPGNGKTMLAKAAATSIAKAHGSENTGFIYVKGPEILSKWVGVSEATIRQLFRQAREFKAEHGYPALLFIDEAEAILSIRGSGISSDIEKTIVPQFLSEMDGLEESGCFVLLATNRADRLDPAVVRDGRIDRTITVPRPTEETAQSIFEVHLKGKPFKDATTVKQMAKFATAQLFDEKHVLFQVNRKSGGETIFTLGSIANGAMCAGIVDRATSFAMERDIESKNRRGSGLSKEDLKAAVAAVVKAQANLDHTKELSDLIEDFRDDVAGIRRVQVAAA